MSTKHVVVKNLNLDITTSDAWTSAAVDGNGNVFLFSKKPYPRTNHDVWDLFGTDDCWQVGVCNYDGDWKESLVEV